MADDEQVPTAPDARTPNMARMYDYALGGKDNYAVDRAAIEKLFQMSPENRYVPRANRRFLGRAVRFVAGQGIKQFLDLGPAFPVRAMCMRSPGRSAQTRMLSISMTILLWSTTPGRCWRPTAPSPR